MEPQVYTLRLTTQEIELLGRALGEMPFKLVAELINKFNAQLKEQIKPAESETP